MLTREELSIGQKHRSKLVVGDRLRNGCEHPGALPVRQRCIEQRLFGLTSDDRLCG
jgi:hypothetical protein